MSDLRKSGNLSNMSHPLMAQISKCCPDLQFLSSDLSCMKETEEELIKTETAVLPSCGGKSKMVEIVNMTDLSRNRNTSDLALTCWDIVIENNSTREIQIRCDDFLSNGVMMIVFTIFGVVSLISLSIVFIVYWVIPDFQTIHGKIVLNNVMSVSFVIAFLLIVFHVNITSDTMCEIFGYFGYYSTISMFSWMTIMCFDLFKTFAGQELKHNRFQLEQSNITITSLAGSATLGDTS